jgi:hypothetical protein
MEQFRAEDLQRLTDSDAVTQFIMLTDGPVLYDTPGDGFIEQQRLSQEMAACKDWN